MFKTDNLRLLMEEANKVRGTLLVEDKNRANELAREWNLNDVAIIDFDDLRQGKYYLGQSFFIHGVNQTIKDLFSDVYGLYLCGYSEVR